MHPTFILLKIDNFLLLNESLIFIGPTKVLNRSIELSNNDFMGRAKLTPLVEIVK